MPSTNLIAFDLGAESGRALLGTLAAGRLALTELHRFANTPCRMNGHLHRSEEHTSELQSRRS
jgi:rhamnulokinase